MAEPQPAIAPESAQFLLIDGMSCASRVEKALEKVPGVSQARVNLGECSALVMGEASAQQLVKAVEAAGYHAQPVENEQERRDKQQRSARKAMRRFS
nr:Copper-exporting P-type ATPase A [Candidatus Pantoea persica]